MHEKETRELYNSISQSANSGTINSEELRKQFQHDHNALQCRVFFELVVPIVEEMAEYEYTDARNERAQEKAKEMLGD